MTRTHQFHNLILFFMFQFNKFSDGFNLDVTHPMIYSDPHFENRIVLEKASYFGYTLILFRGDNYTKPWIQVGAPRGHNPSLPIQCPGAVFRCIIKEACTMISIDRETGIGYYNSLTYTSKMDEAWIGGTMVINNDIDRQVICGFRWISDEGKKYHMLGACYWSTLYSNSSTYIKLLPLLTTNNNVITYSGQTFYHYGQGQAGFSAHLTGSKNQPMLLLGAPGFFNWGGTSILYNNLTQGPIYPDIVDQRNILSLNGYAVTSGYYFNESELLFIESSPKRNKEYYGEVIVYSINLQTGVSDKKESKRGSQLGEFFGASLASGDLNNDGLTDLIVGAPFFKSSKYNEGRVYIFYGSRKKSLQKSENVPHLTGTLAGAQFGHALAYLGDIDIDGYGDIAIGAPHESGSGTVYIFRGSENGIRAKSSQTIQGKAISPRIRGFGIGFSNTEDVDRNGYVDLAVGSHLSGHAIILRSKPVIKLHQSVTVWDKKFNLNQTSVEVCLWFDGLHVPSNINVERKILIDDALKRLFLDQQDILKQLILMRHIRDCSNYTIRAKENVNDIVSPVNIKVVQKLIEQNLTSKPYYVGSTKDEFCKTCPVLGDYKPLDINVPFALGCGDDNICNSFLTFDAIFSGLTEDGYYIIGSSDYIRMDMSVYNKNESAYLTQLHINLPRPIKLRFTPKWCSERNESTLVCSVANPLKEGERKEQTLQLNMLEASKIISATELQFNISVITSSENKNPIQSKIFLLSLKREADVYVTGKSSQEIYIYGNDSKANSSFSQVYQIQKVGKSPVNDISFILQIPAFIETEDTIATFLKIHSNLGVINDQPIICKNLTYIEYLESNDYGGSDMDDDELIENSPVYLRGDLGRKKRSLNDNNIVYSNNLNESENEQVVTSKLIREKSSYTNNIEKIFEINCNNSYIRCADILCTITTLKSEKHVGVIQLKGNLNVSLLKPFLEEKDGIILSTKGVIYIPNFIQTGDMPDSAVVDSIFLGVLPEAHVDLWIIIVSIVAGLLLLLLLIAGLTKAGFFTRKKKEELKQLKYANEVEDFEKNAKLSTSVAEENAPPTVENEEDDVFKEIDMKLNDSKSNQT